MKRRDFIETLAVSTAVLNLTDREAIANPSPAAPLAAPQRGQDDNLKLETSTDLLRFDPKTGRLTSLLAKTAADQEFIKSTAADPVFAVQYLDDKAAFRRIASTQAAQAGVNLADD